MNLKPLIVLLLLSVGASAQTAGSPGVLHTPNTYATPNDTTISFSGISFESQNANVPNPIPTSPWVLFSSPNPTNFNRFEVHHGDIAPVDAGTTKERSEWFGRSVIFANNTPIWISYSQYIFGASNWGNGGAIVGQLRGVGISGPGSGGVVPAFVSMTPAGVMNFNVYASTEDPIVDPPPLNNVLSLPTPLVNQWVNWVFQVNFVPSGGGTWNVWRNGIQILAYSGAMGTTNGFGTSYKFGIYRTSGSQPPLSIATVWYANMEVGTTDLSARIATPKPITSFAIY